MASKKTVSALDVLGKPRIDELKSKHGAVHELILEAEELGQDEDLLVVVHKPTRSAFARFLKDSQSNAYNAMRAMVLDCTVHPSLEDMRLAFEAEPGLVVSIGNKLATLARANLEVLEKKL